MTKKRKIELLEFRVKQLEEINQTLLDSSTEEVKNKIAELEDAICQYNGLIDELSGILGHFRKVDRTLKKDVVKARKRFFRNVRKYS